MHSSTLSDITVCLLLTYLLIRAINEWFTTSPFAYKLFRADVTMDDTYLHSYLKPHIACNEDFNVLFNAELHPVQLGDETRRQHLQIVFNGLRERERIGFS